MGGEESKCGYQVSRVIPNSPAHTSGLLPFFDFIVGVDNLPIEDDSPFFKEYLRSHNHQNITLEVFNTRVKGIRKVPICPNDQWGGQGVLGCSIMWENIDKAFMFGWHVLDIRSNSNAQKVGLQAHRDYIIGMEALGAPELYCTMFTDEQDFQRRLDKFMALANDPQSKRYHNYNVLLLVYDSVENTIREIVGQIPLGCDVGNGFVHTIPSSKGDPRLPLIVKFFNPAEYPEFQPPSPQTLEAETHTNPTPQQIATIQPQPLQTTTFQQPPTYPTPQVFAQPTQVPQPFQQQLQPQQNWQNYAAPTAPGYNPVNTPAPYGTHVQGFNPSPSPYTTVPTSQPVRGPIPQPLNSPYTTSIPQPSVPVAAVPAR